MLSTLPAEQLKKGVVCASAGNHAQGFAYSCKKLNCQWRCFHAGNNSKTKGKTNENVW